VASVAGFWTRAVVVAGLLVGLQACETMKVNSDYDRSVSFTGYDTFSWISEHPMVSHAPEVSPIAERRIQDAIVDTLGAKGIRYVPNQADADFVVGFSVGSREKVSVTSTTYPVAYRGVYRWGGMYYNDVDVRQYTEGRLAIDVFDTREKRPVWHGYVTKNVTSSDQNKREELIREAVAKILAGFPPGVASAQ